MQDDLPGIVALGNDALQLGALHDQQGTDVMRRHLPYGLEYRVLGLNGIQSPAFALNQLSNHGHGQFLSSWPAANALGGSRKARPPKSSRRKAPDKMNSSNAR